MKKMIFMLLLAVLSVAGVSAQNANRSGFFLELGAGGFVINPPMLKVTTTYKQTGTSVPSTISGNDVIEYENVLKYSFNVGYRFAKSRHWAVDCRLNCMFSDGMLDEMFVVGIMYGARYVSPELFRNFSLYGALSVGPMFRLDKIDYVSGDVNIYGGANFELGCNLSNKLYMGAFLSLYGGVPSPEYNEYYNEYIEDKQYTDEIRINGLLGAKLGFRF